MPRAVREARHANAAAFDVGVGGDVGVVPGRQGLRAKQNTRQEDGETRRTAQSA